jgi:hypothetical protein
MNQLNALSNRVEYRARIHTSITAKGSIAIIHRRVFFRTIPRR